MSRTAHHVPGYRFRLVVGFAIVAGLFSLAWAWTVASPITDLVVEQQQDHLRDMATTGAAVLANGDSTAQDAVDLLSSDTDLRVTVIAQDGTVLADSDEQAEDLENHGDRPEVRSALEGRLGADSRLSGTQGIERMYVAVPGTYENNPVAVRVSRSIAHIAQVTGRVRTTGLLALAAVLALSAVLIGRLASTAAAPVERLARSARTMADGDLGAPVPRETGALQPLADSLAVLRDELKARIGALEAEEHTLRLALDGLGDGVVLLDGRTTRLVNRELAAALGTPAELLRGRALDRLGLPAPVAHEIDSRIGAPHAATIELGPDPFDQYVRLHTAPLGEGEHGPRTLAVITDITDRERLDAVRRDFVANASHELKTPTAGIMLLAESAEQAAGDGDTAHALTFVGQIRDESARLRRLVLDLLDLSRLESTPATGEVTDCRRAIDLVVTAYRRRAAEKTLALSANLSAVAGQDVAVRAEATDVAVALDNLVSNAITYTEYGRVVVGLAADDTTVTITVEDTGIGIPAADLERVLERFYRVDRARSRVSGGTGLGLSLVKHVAVRSGGSLAIDSVEGAGTTVRLTLPRAR